MQIEGNEWHQEILYQIPRLYRYYLEWLVELGKSGDMDWERGYDALPDQARDGIATDIWFNDEKFQEALGREVKDIPWLPLAIKGHDSSMFLSPAQARVLPPPIARLFDDGSGRHTRLFGEHAISARLLGARAARFLKSLGFFNELEPLDFAHLWESGNICDWYFEISEEERINKLGELLAALSELDARPSWKNAALQCLPTESGKWTNRFGEN